MRSPTFWLVAALLLSVALCVLHASLHLSWKLRAYASESFVYLANLASPSGLHSWLSIATLALLGWVCLLLGRENKRLATVLAGVFFLLLALDDACEFHEAVGYWLSPFFSSDGIYVWILVLGPVLALVGIFLFWHFWSSVTTRPRRLLVFFGFASMALALIIEAAEADLRQTGIQVRGITLDRYTQVPEEFLEFLGPWLLLVCFLRELRDARSRRRDGGGADGSSPPPAADVPAS